MPNFENKRKRESPNHLSLVVIVVILLLSWHISTIFLPTKGPLDLISYWTTQFGLQIVDTLLVVLPPVIVLFVISFAILFLLYRIYATNKQNSADSSPIEDIALFQRAYGAGLIAVTSRPSLISRNILANSSTKVFFQCPLDSNLVGDIIKLTPEQRQVLSLMPERNAPYFFIIIEPEVKFEGFN